MTYSTIEYKNLDIKISLSKEDYKKFLVETLDMPNYKHKIISCDRDELDFFPDISVNKDDYDEINILVSTDEV